MTAAIYARKSTEQRGADDEAKSVARQIDNARSFAAAKGWTVADAHVYSDDAISGAETRKLVSRQRLLDVIASGRAPFQILIVRDASRFSRRDGDVAFSELKRIAQAGVAIHFYSDGTQFTFGTFGDNIVGFVRAEAAAEYRRQIAKWTTEAMVRKAAHGHVTGGRVFGYENVRVDGHVERRILEEQAAVVRRIFELSAQGTGYTRITKQLNADRAPAPRPQQQRPAGWSPSTVREVLHRPLYRGEVVWNKTKKRDAEGKTAPTARPEAQWLRQQRPDLLIVSDELWAAAHARLGSGGHRQKANHRTNPRRDRDSRYLLTGFARCGSCGGSLTVLSRSTGRGKDRLYAYGCLAHAKRGDTVCDNALVLPMERLDTAVLAKLGRDVLRPAAVRAIIAGVFEELKPKNVSTNTAGLRQQLRALDDKIANLTAAVESGQALAPLVARLAERQAEREAVQKTLAAAEAVAQVQVDRQTVERTVLSQIDRWRNLLATDGRQVMREALVGPIRCRPVDGTYHFDGRTATGRLIADLVGGVSYLSGVPNGIREGLATPLREAVSGRLRAA